MDWNRKDAFLKREDLADGAALGLITVRTVKAGDATLYIAGGRSWIKSFWIRCPVAEGMRVQLYRNFEPLAPPQAWARKLAPALVQESASNRAS